VNVEETEDRRIGSVVLLVGEMLSKAVTYYSQFIPRANMRRDSGIHNQGRENGGKLSENLADA